MFFRKNHCATVGLPRYPIGKSGYPMKAPPEGFQQYSGNLYVYECVSFFAVTWCIMAHCQANFSAQSIYACQGQCCNPATYQHFDV